MAQSDYPTGAEVQCFVEQSGLVLPDHFDPNLYTDEAIALWEEETGYKPFKQGSSATYSYDPPGPDFKGEVRGGGKLLFLGRGFTTITAVKTGVTYNDATGTTLVATRDYRLLPYNYSADKVPITAIEFVSVPWGEPMSIRVTGTPGYSSELSDAVYAAIIKLAASRIAMAIREGIAGDVIEWAEDDVRERMSIELIQKLGTTWSSEARRAIARYTLITR